MTKETKSAKKWNCGLDRIRPSFHLAYVLGAADVPSISVAGISISLTVASTFVLLRGVSKGDLGKKRQFRKTTPPHLMVGTEIPGSVNVPKCDLFLLGYYQSSA